MTPISATRFRRWLAAPSALPWIVLVLAGVLAAGIVAVVTIEWPLGLPLGLAAAVTAASGAGYVIEQRDSRRLARQGWGSLPVPVGPTVDPDRPEAS
ncbi:hypothetical protein [Corynebacterium sp. AOP12-C2-36]|uniref:hypothetical protein n=1 Tax=Corynebacterium sp. AOP12-C2-36 TaxID=3457723 RepID=UPI0040334F52